VPEFLFAIALNPSMSTFGPKQTFASALHMAAFVGKADMTVCGSPLSRSLFGGKADMLFCAAYRTFGS